KLTSNPPHAWAGSMVPMPPARSTIRGPDAPPAEPGDLGAALGLVDEQAAMANTKVVVNMAGSHAPERRRTFPRGPGRLIIASLPPIVVCHTICYVLR